MTFKTFISFFLMIALSSMNYAQNGSITVTVEKIKSDTGIIQIGLYNSKDSFPSFEKNYKGSSIKANKIGVNHTFTDIPSGTYAIAIWQDLNENGKLDKKMLGPPKEPYGFSNNKYGSFGPPNYNDVAFEVLDNKTTKLIINLK